MTVARWEPKADDIAQIDLLTIAGGWADASETITLTINKKTLVITIGSLITATQVATTIKQAWESETFTDTTASVVPSGGGQGIVEFAEITATSASAVVTLKHDTEGEPFMLTEEETSTSGTITPSTPTAATGQNHWDDANNWSGGIVPIASTADEVYVGNSDVDILHGLAQSGVTIASLTIAASYTGRIGLPKTNEGGYDEYRTDYLEIGATTVTIGNGEGGGSGRIKINAGAVGMALTVQSTGTAEEDGVESVLWKGSGTNTIDVQSGSVGCASFGGETAAITTLRVTSGKVKLGAGATVTTVVSQGGDVTLASATAAVTIESGTITILGTGAHTAITVNGGTCDYRSSGVITTLNLGGTTRHAVFDCSRDMRDRTISNFNHKLNASVLDPVNTLTITSGVVIDSNVSAWETS